MDILLVLISIYFGAGLFSGLVSYYLEDTFKSFLGGFFLWPRDLHRLFFPSSDD